MSRRVVAAAHVAPDGRPHAGAAVTAQLVGGDGRAVDAWEAASGVRIAGVTKTLVTRDGTWSLSLSPNDVIATVGGATSYWLVCVDGFAPVRVQLPSGDADADFYDLVAAATAVAGTDVAAVVGHVTNSSLHVPPGGEVGQVLAKTVTGPAWSSAAAGSGAVTFAQLLDTPGGYGAPGQMLVTTPSGIGYQDAPAVITRVGQLANDSGYQTAEQVAAGMSLKADLAALGTAATRDVPAAGNAASAQVVIGSDSRLGDARAPLAHTHPYEPALGSPTVDGQVLASTAAGVRSWVSLGGSSGDATAAGELFRALGTAGQGILPNVLTRITAMGGPAINEVGTVSSGQVTITLAGSYLISATIAVAEANTLSLFAGIGINGAPPIQDIWSRGNTVQEQGAVRVARLAVGDTVAVYAFAATACTTAANRPLLQMVRNAP